ncbi:MAG: T9SS type A sorting domain-containing protein [Ignavibacteria bacterium]|nr:T9SS type A sorting domain-containing protein [Ignavibacteria bacterium]
MKKLFFISILLIISFKMQAQINLDFSFPAPNSNSNALSIIKFGIAGDKYVYLDQVTNIIQIYGINQVLETTIHIPSFATFNFYSLLFITDNLFNTDANYEYLITVNGPEFSLHTVYILDQDSNILLSRDSVSYIYSPNYSTSNFTSIFPTIEGTKLIIKYPFGYDIFSLPGTLPCYECSNGAYTGYATDNGGNDGKFSLNASPNPANNLTRIDYSLPDGIKQGELVFYNLDGMEMKRFKVTSQFSYITVSTNDLRSGTYLYQLTTSSGTSGSKKLVVIK